MRTTLTILGGRAAACWWRLPSEATVSDKGDEEAGHQEELSILPRDPDGEGKGKQAKTPSPGKKGQKSENNVPGPGRLKRKKLRSEEDAPARCRLVTNSFSKNVASRLPPLNWQKKKK